VAELTTNRELMLCEDDTPPSDKALLLTRSYTDGQAEQRYAGGTPVGLLPWLYPTTLAIGQGPRGVDHGTPMLHVFLDISWRSGMILEQLTAENPMTASQTELDAANARLPLCGRRVRPAAGPGPAAVGAANAPNKPNLPRFWAKNAGRAKNKANLASHGRKIRIPKLEIRNKRKSPTLQTGVSAREMSVVRGASRVWTLRKTKRAPR
jgi:hypothetical protein